MADKKRLSTVIKESALAYYNYTMQGGGLEVLNIERDFIATRIVCSVNDEDDYSKEITIKINRRAISNIAVPVYLFKDSRYPFKFPTPYYLPAGTELKIEGLGDLTNSTYISFEGFFVKPLERDYIDDLYVPYMYAIKDQITAGEIISVSNPLPILREYDFELTTLIAFVNILSSPPSFSYTLNFTTNIKKQNGVKLYRDDMDGEIVYGSPEFPHRLNLPVKFRGGTSLLPNMTINNGGYPTDDVIIWRFLIGRNV